MSTDTLLAPQAEAVFEPFRDPDLSGLASWRIEPGEAHGLTMRKNWCNVIFERERSS